MNDNKNDVELMDKDLAAKTIEPIVTLVLDQLVSKMGLDAIQGLLPIDVSVVITLRSGERKITTATMESRIDDLNPVS
jgi:hypothetical protein